MTIEERIQELRKAKGLSQEQLAEVLGVSRQAVSKWEGGQSLPEIEKLIAMSELFEVSIDYILKGGSPRTEQDDSHKSRLIGSQVVSAVAMMLLAVGLIATQAQFSDGTYTMDIYGGLVIQVVGVMILLIGWFLAGGRVINKTLFVVNILLAAVLPSSLVSQALLRLYPTPLPLLAPVPILIFALVYLIISGTVIYFALIRRKGPR